MPTPEELVVVAAWQSPSHAWEYVGKLRSGEAPLEVYCDCEKWALLRCKWCGVTLAYQTVLACQTVMRWRDGNGWHGVWLLPLCEDVLMGSVHDS